MTDKSIVQYVGHKVTPESREYSFTVRDPAGAHREFALAIPLEAFATQRVRFQDAAEICSIRLRQELIADPYITAGRFRVSDADLEAYRAAHSPKKPPLAIRKKPEAESA